MANGIQSLGTDYPIVWLSYQHSFKDVLRGEYEFDRLKFQMEKDFQTRYIGKSSVLLQAGYASKGCPVMETFNIMGSYEPFGLYSPGSFATMRESDGQTIFKCKVINNPWISVSSITVKHAKTNI